MSVHTVHMTDYKFTYLSTMHLLRLIYGICSFAIEILSLKTSLSLFPLVVWSELLFIQGIKLVYDLG